MMADPVSEELRSTVLERDGFSCVAVTLGEPATSCSGRLQLDHVRDQPQVGDPIVKRGPARKHRYRAPSDVRHLVSVCEGHHIWNGWATSHRPELRDYLRRVNA